MSTKHLALSVAISVVLFAVGCTGGESKKSDQGGDGKKAAPSKPSQPQKPSEGSGSK